MAANWTVAKRLTFRTMAVFFWLSPLGSLMPIVTQIKFWLEFFREIFFSSVPASNSIEMINFIEIFCENWSHRKLPRDGAVPSETQTKWWTLADSRIKKKTGQVANNVLHVSWTNPLLTICLFPVRDKHHRNSPDSERKQWQRGMNSTSVQLCSTEMNRYSQMTFQFKTTTANFRREIQVKYHPKSGAEWKKKKVFFINGRRTNKKPMQVKIY